MQVNGDRKKEEENDETAESTRWGEIVVKVQKALGDISRL
jgi:hypothetical protein